MGLHALSQDTIRLIKSTQVITTPGSIVKELVENALDAGAKSITIKMENHGFSLIEVRDNGMGIKEEDVDLIAKPHHTSKISSFSDLASLTTYGFRGEALASLCAVSDCCVTTKTTLDSMAHTYTFDQQGNIANVKPAAAPNGTTVSVHKLFKNVPVRRQYYTNAKRRREELKKIEDMVMAFSLAAPGTHLTLSHDKHCLMQKSPGQDLRGAVMNAFPTAFKDMVKKERNFVDIPGKLVVYLPGPKCSSNPSLARTTPDRLFILINQRPVTHRPIEKMVKGLFSQGSEGCHSHYPIGVVALTLPSDALDVNLEPNKTKMHLQDEDVILETLKEILCSIYPTSNTISKVSGEKEALAESVDTEIACTFAGITQPQRDTLSSSESDRALVQKDTKMNIPQEKEFLMDVKETISKEGRGALVSKLLTRENCIKTKRLSACIETSEEKEKNANLQSLNSKKLLTSVGDLFVEKKEVGRTENYRSNNERENGQVSNLQNGFQTSTQTSNADATFPSFSESDIPPDEDLMQMLDMTDSDLSFPGPVSNYSSPQPYVSGIEPLQTSSSSLQNIGEKHRGLNTPECSVQALTSGLSRREKSSFQPNQERHKLHETVIGSDGIPVFKIAPLPTSDTMSVQDLEEQNEQGMEGNEKSINSRKAGKQSSQDVFKEPHSEQESEIQDRLQTISGVEASEICNSKSEEENTVGGCWSRGLPVNGKNIQTVQVITAAAAETKFSSCQLESAPKKRMPPEAPDENVCLPSKRTKINSLGPANFDYICGKPVKKPSSPFILFSRDIRSQVLSEHPGADFAFIAQQMAARWKALGPEEKLHYNNLAKDESVKYQEQVKKLQEGHGLNCSQKVSLHKGHMTKGSLDRYVAPVTPRLDRTSGKTKGKPLTILERPWQDHCKEVPVNLNSIRKRLKRKQLQLSCDTSFQLIGSLTVTEGGWICLQDENIYALNIYRVYEKVLVHTLLDSFSLPLKILSDAIPFNSSSLGLENWKTILQLPRESCRDRNFHTITDPRLINNGFKVALYPGSSGDITHGEVTHLTPAVGYIGIADLKEILVLIAAAFSDSLYLSRPLKIQHWIKGEAVRMIRSGPNIIQRDDVLEKLRKWRGIQQKIGNQDNVLWEKETCIHNKPMLTQLYCLDSLPQSQSQR